MWSVLSTVPEPLADVTGGGAGCAVRSTRPRESEFRRLLCRERGSRGCCETGIRNVSFHISVPIGEKT